MPSHPQTDDPDPSARQTNGEPSRNDNQHGLTPERQRKRRRRQVNRQSGLRYQLPAGLLQFEKGESLPEGLKVLARTHHVYTITESRENLARDAFERLARDMGANAVLNITTREDSEQYGGKVFRRFVIKGTPAIVGAESRAPSAVSKSMAIRHFPNPAVVKAYKRRARDLQRSEKKIRADEGFERMDRSIAQNVLFGVLVVLALIAAFAFNR